MFIKIYFYIFLLLYVATTVHYSHQFLMARFNFVDAVTAVDSGKRALEILGSVYIHLLPFFSFFFILLSDY
jgi:hypothetical protein